MGLRRPFAGRLVVACVVLAAATWALLRWREHPVTCDDAFISYRYAYNLVHGRGLVYNAGERVEGYTNFLWVLLSAAALRAGRDPLAVTRDIGVGAYVASVAIVAWVAMRPVRRSLVSPMAGLALASLLVLPAGFAAFAGTGLETSFVGLTVLLLGVVHHLVPSSRPAWWFFAAALPLVAVLTRLDASLAVFASALAAFLDGRAWRNPKRLRELLILFGPSAAGLALYLSWKRVYYGDILPNSYYAKAADGLHPDAGLAYVAAFVQSCPASILLVLLAVSGLVIAGRGPRSRFLSYGVIALSLQVAYAIKVGGDFMEYRFMWELWPLLVCAAVVGAAEVVSRAPSIVAVAAVLALSVASVPTVLEKKYGMQSIPQMDDYASLGRRVGVALANASPPGTVIATTLAGMAYFMPEVTTIDQWGLNDRFVAHRPLRRFLEVEGFNARGHVKYASEAYLRSRGVNLLVEHPTVCDCDQLCRENRPEVYVRLGHTNACLRSWYLTPTDELTAWFCSHPKEFVLDRVACPVNRGGPPDR